MVEVVEETVRKDKDADGASREEGAPPPLVVLGRQLEVRQRDGDEGGNEQQQAKSEEKDAIERVHLYAWRDGGEGGRGAQEMTHPAPRYLVSGPLMAGC